MDENNKEAFNESNKMIERGSHKSTAKFIIIFVVICGVLWLAYNLLTSTFGVGPTQITEDSIPCIYGPGIMCPDDDYTGRSYNSLERSIHTYCIFFPAISLICLSNLPHPQPNSNILTIF